MMEKERKLIGQGRIASIYSDGSYAYKTFPEDYHLNWIKYEVNIQQEVYEKTKLPVVKYDLNEENKEIKMGMINGITLAKRIKNEKYKNGLEDLVAIQKCIHSYSDLNIPDAFESFESRIKRSVIDEDLKIKALISLNSIERKSVLCHFDLHFENMMYDGNQYFIIDWVDAKLGNPVLDVARSYLILKQYIPTYAEKYLRLAENELNVSKADVDKALPVIAAIRLQETDDPDFIKILTYIVNGLKQ